MAVKEAWVKLRVEPEDKLRWEAAAKKHGISMSEFLRRSANIVERIGFPPRIERRY